MSFATFKACPSSVHSITTLKDVAAITVMWNRTNRSRRWRKSAAPNWTSDDEDSNWGPPQGRHTVAKPFTVALEVVTENEAPSISKDSTLLSVIMLYYTGVINCWWNWQTCVANSTWTCRMKDHYHLQPLPDMTVYESPLYLTMTMTVKMGYDTQDNRTNSLMITRNLELSICYILQP